MIFLIRMVDRPDIIFVGPFSTLDTKKCRPSPKHKLFRTKSTDIWIYITKKCTILTEVVPMESVKHEISKLRNKVAELEGVSLDVKGIKLQLDKIGDMLLQTQQPEVPVLRVDPDVAKTRALEKMMVEAISAARNTKSGLIFLVATEYKRNQPLIVHSQSYDYNDNLLTQEDTQDNADDAFNRLSNFIQTMSNIERLKMLVHLGERDRSVKEIQKIVRKKGGSLYHHINALIKEGLILKIGSNYALSEQGREALILLGLLAQEAMFLSSFRSER